MAYRRRDMTDNPTLPAAARRALWRTHAGLMGERVAGAFWPMWTVWLAAGAVWVMDLPNLLDLEYVWLLLVAFAIGSLWAGAYAVRRFRWPRRAEAAARLDATIPGRPLAAVSDRQSIGTEDAASRALWRAHLARMADRLADARPVAPDLRLSRSDRYALRYVAATAFVVAILFGLSGRDGRPTQVFGGAAAPSGPFYEAWVQPPAYTGKPTIYLNETPQNRLVEVPQGSRLLVRLYGDLDRMTLTQSVGPRPDRADDAEDVAPLAETEIEMQATGDLRLEGPGGAAAAWRFSVIDDLPPEGRLDGMPEASIHGRLDATVALKDDYGVRQARVEIRLDPARLSRRHGLRINPEPREPIVSDVPMPIRGDRTDVQAEVIEDMAKHPWAGLPVLLRVVATDAADQSNDGPDAPVILPARTFFDPMADALVEMRRDLLWSRTNAMRVAQILRALTYLPEDEDFHTGAYLIVRTVIDRLEVGLRGGAIDTELRDESAEALWQAALLIEEGGVANAAERLRRAQERLADALERGATDEELQQLMDELREAMREYMQALAEEAQRNGDQQQAENQPGQEMTPQDLQQMLDEIQRLAEEGRTEEAQRLLEQLRRMMENMQVTQRPGQSGEGQQAMENLQDTLRQQQGLSDEAFRQLQEQYRQGNQSGQSQQNQGRNGTQGRGQDHEGQGQGEQSGEQIGNGELSARQRALREALREQQRRLPGQGTDAGRRAQRSLDRAGEAMDRAADALRDGRTNDALDEQAEAMDALREGIQDLGQALAEQDPNRGQQGQQAGAPNPENRDPLGRRSGTNGRIGSDERLLDGGEVARRSQELRNEIRRRSGERDRPEIELDYLKRLLEQF